jgi:hypothetical protein
MKSLSGFQVSCLAATDHGEAQRVEPTSTEFASGYRAPQRNAVPGNRLQVAAGLLMACILLLVTGCGGLFTRFPQLAGGPDQVLIETVPFHAQEQYQCGPAAMAMLLGWNGLAVSPAALSPQIYSPGLKGSLQPALIAAARRHGYLAYPITGGEALFAELIAGHPVIVLQNLGLSWYPRWHYAVVIGYDRPEKRIVLHSGKTSEEELPFRVFDNTWARSERWGLLVMPPDRLPATATEDAYLAAAVGLEQARQPQAAATAYQTALTRWPGSFVAWMGLGNSRYALNEQAGAEQAFRRAAKLKPDDGAAFNNLARVLAEQGKQQEALAAARQAVSRGGPLLEHFQKTLEEIQASQP